MKLQVTLLLMAMIVPPTLSEARCRSLAESASLGSEYGTFPLYRAFPDAFYHLIDPAHESLAHMQKLAKKLRAKVHPVALGDHDGTATLEVRADIQESTLLEEVGPRRVRRVDETGLVVGPVQPLHFTRRAVHDLSGSDDRSPQGDREHRPSRPDPGLGRVHTCQQPGEEAGVEGVACAHVVDLGAPAVFRRPRREFWHWDKEALR